MARALRLRTATATGSVAVAPLDSATGIEVMGLCTGEVIRAILNTGNVWNPWILANGGSANADIKMAFRFADTGSGSLANIQMRHQDGVASLENTTQTNVDISGISAWDNCAFFGGVSGGNKYFQVARLDPRDGTVTQVVAVAPTAVSAALAAVTGVRAYVNPPVSTSLAFGGAQADVTHAGCDLLGFWVKVGAQCSGGNFATVADMFTKPDPSSVTVLWGFADGSGQADVADETSGGYDVTLAGTELTDYVWIGENPAYDLDDNTAPSGAYTQQFGGSAATQVQFRNGRAEGHASDRNTANSVDPEWGFGGTGGAGPVNIKTDTWRWLSSMEDVQASPNWLTSDNVNGGEGGNNNAIRDDLLATGEQTGSLNWLLAPQFVAGASGAQIFLQRKFSGGLINNFGTTSVTASAGPVLQEVWGAGSGFVQARAALPGTNDWTVLYDSAVQTETANWTSVPSTLGWRWQSKNRTLATSVFAGSEVTYCDEVGSALVGLWDVASATVGPICPHTGLACAVGLGFAIQGG